jgi:hypothetical protein
MRAFVDLGYPHVSTSDATVSMSLADSQLETMSEAMLCHPCEALFKGQWEYMLKDDGTSDSDWIMHHTTTESLKSALELSCSICTSLWKSSGSESCAHGLEGS